MGPLMTLVVTLSISILVACVAVGFAWLLVRYLDGPSSKQPRYNWLRVAGLEPEPQLIPSGTHYVRISDVQHFDDKGDLVRDKLMGDQAIVVIFEDNHNRRASRQYSLRDMSSLAHLLSNCNPDGLYRLQRKNIAPDKFKIVSFAKKMLLGQSCWIRVEIVNGFVRACSVNGPRFRSDVERLSASEE